MFRFRKRAGGAGRFIKTVFEPLESRRLLSSVYDVFMHSDAVIKPDATSGSVLGYTPAQIRHAYQFDQVSLNGAGQTIAIVDAYNDPNIAADLSVFDSQFGLSAPPSLSVVNQNAGSSLPSTDGGWAGEISLDVEWAHAIAPQANILLVEAKSASLADLMTAVDTARHAAGVSVVSMSWGGSEFFSWNGSEWTGQTQYDPFFTTPANHQGVTFVAAAGDSGVWSGVQWPASSHNVLSVGGTSLYTSDNSGTYYTENSWSGTSSGYSQVESQPNYQATVQNTGVRSVADVSYDADPNTGFAVYDSVPYQGYIGCEEIGGTSAGAPQWAALVALADQARIANGQATLDGASQTLPLLYNLYSAPGTDGYSVYATGFNDVVDPGSTNPWHWRWGGFGNGAQATVGYDTSTGLGSPNARLIIPLLEGDTSISTTGSGNSNSGGGQTVSNQDLPASPILGSILSTSLPTSAVDGSNGSFKLRLSNGSNSRFDGPVSITLYSSTAASLASGDATAIATFTLPRLKLGAGALVVKKFKFTYPSDLAANNYFLIASISTSSAFASADAVSASTVAIAPPTVDLSTAFAKNRPITVQEGKGDNVILTIENLGNVAAVGNLELHLYASGDQTLDASDTVLTTIPTRKIHLAPGKSIKVRVHFTAPPNQTPGSYFLIAASTSATQIPDTNTANDAAVAPTA